MQRMVLICSVLFASLFFGGCGKHACAICGEEADREFSVDGKNFHICEECHQTYIEAGNLFDEEWETNLPGEGFGGEW